MKAKFAKIKEYWRRMMDSTQRKLSRGSAVIAKGTPHGHGEEWRGSKEVKK